MSLIKRAIFAALLLASGFLVPAMPAQATILYVGGEDIDTTWIGTVAPDGTAGHFRSGFARYGLLPNYSATGANPPTSRIVTPNFTNQSTVWVHLEAWSSNTNCPNGNQVAALYGSDGVRRLLIRCTGTAGQVKISTQTTAAAFADLATCTAGAYPVAGLIKLDWFANYAVSGETTLYFNGASPCDFTGNITTNSVTALNQLDLASPCSNVNCVGSNENSWSEIIVSTTDTRSMNLVTLAPVATGVNQGWAGVVGSINPTSINDANNISSSSSNVVSEWTIGSLPAGSYSVPAVCQAARVQIGASGPAHFAFIARPGTGSTDNAGSSIAGSGSFANYKQELNGGCWTTNPNTGAAFTTTDLGAGTNFGIESLP